MNIQKTKTTTQHVVVPTASLKYFKHFSENFNRTNTPHNHKFTFIVDDSHETAMAEFHDAFYASNLPIERVISVSSIRRELEQDLVGCTYLDEILKEFGLAIKLVMFYYVLKVLKYDKFLFLDDDTVMIRAMTKLFDNHTFAKKTDMSLDVTSGLLREIYGEEAWGKFTSSTEYRINSGSILYSPTEEKTEQFLQHITKFFSTPRVIKWFAAAKIKAKKAGKKYIMGNSWVLEQHTIGIFFMMNHNDEDWHNIEGEVRIGGNNHELLEENANKGFQKLPSVYHPCCRDSARKLIFFERFLKRLGQTDKKLFV